MMRNLRWVALAPFAIGLVFLFFGLAWTAATQFIVGMLLVAAAACLWRLLGGSWELRPGS